MSHFTVLCVLGTIDPTDDAAINEKVDELLAPYDENDSVDAYRVYEHANILRTTSYHEALEKKFGAPPKSPDRDSYDPADHEKVWAEFDAAQTAYGQAIFDKIGGTKLAKLMSDDGDEYGFDKEKGELYRVSTYNPDSKWDWYQIGGRWSGMFTAKPGSPSAVGQPGVFDNDPGQGVDVLRVGDIDWEAMATAELIRRQDVIDKIDAEGTPQNAMARWYLPDHINPESPGWKERYLAEPPYLATYAWVTEEGEWYQRGKMGWFGMGSDEESEAVWNAKWLEAIKKLSPNTVVAVVDCHI